MGLLKTLPFFNPGSALLKMSHHLPVAVLVVTVTWRFEAAADLCERIIIECVALRWRKSHGKSILKEFIVYGPAAVRISLRRYSPCV